MKEKIDQILKAIEENGEDANTLWIGDLLKEMKNKVVIYVDVYNPCCESKEHHSQEELLKRKSKMATIYLIYKNKIDEVWGDDWDDAPSCCNSEPPSDIEKLGIEKIVINLGERLI